MKASLVASCRRHVINKDVTWQNSMTQLLMAERAPIKLSFVAVAVFLAQAACTLSCGCSREACSLEGVSHADAVHTGTLTYKSSKRNL